VETVLNSLWVLDSLRQNLLDPAMSVALILAYFNSTNGILHLGNKVKRLSKSLVYIQDLYDFIRKFGKQTFPVLPEK
jgi:hypothetical protein